MASLVSNNNNNNNNTNNWDEYNFLDRLNISSKKSEIEDFFEHYKTSRGPKVDRDQKNPGIAVNFYQEGMKNLYNTGRFICMHGGPLSPDLIKTNPVAFKIPPQSNCIVVVISQPGVVQFANEDVDKEGWTFLKQYDWPIAGRVGGEGEANCYGADPPYAGVNPDQDLRDRYDGIQDLKEEAKTIAARVLERREKKDEDLAKKNQKKKEDAAGMDYSDFETFKTHPARISELNKNLLNNIQGSEILWSMQVFYPGDWVYNQEHDFEMDTNGNIDKDFNIFRLGHPISNYFDAQRESPIGTIIPDLDGKPHKKWFGDYKKYNPIKGNVVDLSRLDGGPQTNMEPFGNKLDSDDSEIESDSESDTKHNSFLDTGGIRVRYEQYKKFMSKESYIDKKYNNKNQAQVPDEIKTTKKMVDTFINEFGKDQPTIIFINSCSPFRNTMKTKRNVFRGTLQNMDINVLREKIYNAGRKNFCYLRRDLKEGWATGKSGLTLLPQLEDHFGYTKRDKDDREQYYHHVGNFFRFVHEFHDKQTFDRNHFKTFYDMAKKERTGGAMMKMFKGAFIKFYNKEEITKGKNKRQHWNSDNSKIVLFGNNPPQTGEEAFFALEKLLIDNKQGGKKRKTRKKKRKSRKKKRKTRKKKRKTRRKSKTRRRRRKKRTQKGAVKTRQMVKKDLNKAQLNFFKIKKREGWNMQKINIVWAKMKQQEKRQFIPANPQSGGKRKTRKKRRKGRRKKGGDVATFSTITE